MSMVDSIEEEYEDKIEVLNKQIKELEAWIADLQSGLYINCVYCGYRYPPGTPDVRDKVLYEHIKQCKKHPLSKALERITELEAQLEQHRWIPISERLPENIATVFIFTGEGRGGVGFYGEDETGYIWERLDHAINLNITHWKPIIQP